MIILWTCMYVYQVNRMGVGRLKAQLKASIILYKFIIVVAIGETNHIINNLILTNIYIYRE